MATTTILSRGLEAANGKTTSAVAVKALSEKRLDPIALKALNVVKSGSNTEIDDFLEYLRDNALEAKFTEVTKLINKNSRLTEAERLVLKYKLAKIAKESLEDLDGSASDATMIKEAIESLTTGISEKQIIDYERLETIAQSLQGNGPAVETISAALGGITAAIENSAASGNGDLKEVLAALQNQAAAMENLVKTTNDSLATLNNAIDALPETIAEVIKSTMGENR